VTLPRLALFAAATVALMALAQRHFLAAHCIVEIGSIMVAALIAVFSRCTRHTAPNPCLEFLGYVYAAVGAMDLAHTLAYRGMGVLADSADANPATQLWVAARYIQAAGLLAAPWLQHLPWSRRVTAAALTAYVVAVLAAILGSDLFPDCYLEGSGLTRFKVASEVAICALLAGAVVSLRHHRRQIGQDMATHLVAAAGLAIASEVLFASYRNVDDTWNLLGHVLKGASFYCVYLLVTYKGLTEPFEFRRQAEHQLREQDRRLKLAMECAQVGFWQWHAEGDLLQVEPSWFGLLDGDDAGGPVALARLRQAVHPEDAARCQQALREHAAGHTPYAEGDLRLRTAGSEWRWLQVRGYIVSTNPAGRPSRMVGFCQDTTSRRETESEVADLRHRLARAGRVSVAGQLMAALAHEINQPLAAICSNATAALRFLGDRPARAEELPAILADIAADGQRASQVVRRLRDLIRRGRPGEYSEIDVRALIEDVLATARHELALQQVSVRCDAAPDLPRLYADRIEIQLVLLNLVRNAAEAMARAPAPGVGPRLEIRATRKGPHLQLSVTDNGPGIQAADPDAVFTPFVTTRDDGLGMGLVICRSIVEAHKGRIGWTSNPERGVTFHVVLPLGGSACG